MYFLQTHHQKSHPIKKGTFPLTPAHSTEDLPLHYFEILAERNGGYIQKMQVKTEEPTSDGLAHANLHYIYGIHDDSPHSILYQQSLSEQKTLPDYLIVFSRNNKQIFAFDYSQLSNEGEPAIRYIDLETGNWQTVSKDFKTLMDHLEPGEIEIPLEGTLTRMEAEHAFLLISDPVMLTELWMHLEDCADKEWYFSWLLYFADHPNVGIRQATIDALETQILYFRLSLPENTQQIFSTFLNDVESSIRHQAEWLLREWKEKT